MDEHGGVLTCNSAVGLLAGVVLLVLSEVALFVSVIWALVLVLVAHSSYTTAGLLPLAVTVAVDGVEQYGVLYQNTLTLLNTHLLLWTGVLSILAVHAHAMKLPISASLYLAEVVCLGGCFLLVQCCEYVHLYWCLYTAGPAGVFYVVTGVHGGHVLIGLLMLGMYALQLHTWHTWSGYSMDTVHGVVAITLY
eukprot:TRINITY_DN21636_c0_g1_i1.p1 TRINITY_DN21636_c0_g1~~TRINITY_DN21636_c0_g1_i1.p1  ORF type:complete len:193 (-),score=11.35 TRINITY_DN21636_c0_g1_i1:37-615(-)